MTTEHLTPDDIERAGDLLRRGALVVFPTETVYGLGATALNPEAVGAVFHAKERPADNPLIAHFHDSEDVVNLLPPGSEDLIPLVEAFMPGPLTLIVPAPRWAPPVLTGGLETIAVRVPDHPLAAAIIRAAGGPIAAPSANRSGRPSPTTYEMALSEMDGRVDAIVDGGRCEIGIESTVVDIRTPEAFSVLRPGRVTAGEIAHRTGRREARTAEAVRSPGTRYRHYHPGIPVLLVPPGSWDAARREAERICRAPFFHRSGDLIAYAADLYRTFWEAELAGGDCILLEDVPETQAPGLHDRLHRAADAVYVPGEVSRIIASSV